MYHENGQMMYQGNFEYGKESGRDVVFYDELGNISFIGDVVSGIVLGYMEAFNKIERLIHSGQYDDIGREWILSEGFDLDRLSERKPKKAKSISSSSKKDSNGPGRVSDGNSSAKSNDKETPKKCVIF